MPERAPSYVVDPSGKTVAVDQEDLPGELLTGSIPASKAQIEDFLKEQAFHAKYGTTGQQLATFGEGAASALTLGASDWLERGLGVSPEDIAARPRENPGSHLAGTVTGVAVPLILSAGASAPLEGAEGANLAAQVAS
jgi:hypothetical protein